MVDGLVAWGDHTHNEVPLASTMINSSSAQHKTISSEAGETELAGGGEEGEVVGGEAADGTGEGETIRSEVRSRERG